MSWLLQVQYMESLQSKKAPKVASSLVTIAHFKPKNAKNSPNGPS